MRWSSLLGVGALCLLSGCHATTETAASGSVLPLKSLKLYETGVGYFERSGQLSADDSMTLPVPTGHLDDALKTLVVMGTGTTLNGVEFSSSLSRGMARALAGLPAASDEPITWRTLLGSMKGSEVEVRLRGKSSETVEGRLVDVIEPEKTTPADPPEDSGDADKKGKKTEEEEKKPELLLLVVTRDGEFRRIDTAQVISVRPTDPNLVTRMNAALDALSVRSAQTRKALRILAASNKPVTLGYLAEAPIWRTSYRLLLDPTKDRGTLQGWALLHNDTDEAWQGVKIELVNGQPDSFLFPLAAPRYSRRPLAEPEEKLATVPQLLDTTVDQMWGDNLEEGVVGYGYGTGTGQGFGSGHGRLGGSHRARAPQVRMGAVSVGTSDSLRIGNLADIAPAEGVEAGALFSYRLAQPLDLRAHGSALVPFLASQVDARRLTWFSTPGEAGRSALRFINATRQTLPAGPIAIYENGGFAGEAGLERLKPTERAFLSFGVDLDVELDRNKADYEDATKSVYFEKDRLVEDFVRSHVQKYEIKNRSRSTRTVYLELGISDNSKVEGADELDYDRASAKPLAVFRAEPGKKVERTLKIQEGLSRSNYMQNLLAKRLKELAALDAVPPADKAILTEAAARLDEAEAKDKEQEETKAAIEEIDGDLKRLREHLAALGDKSGQGANANPLVKRILDNEDKLLALRAKLKSLEGVSKDKRKAAETVLEKLVKKDAEAAPPAKAK
jgi:hypothetical protein